jgi:hypothetical protein
MAVLLNEQLFAEIVVFGAVIVTPRPMRARSRAVIESSEAVIFVSRQMDDHSEFPSSASSGRSSPFEEIVALPVIL